jgi:two-component system LytT family sensor kinase
MAAYPPIETQANNARMKYIGQSWLKANFMYLCIGILIGLLLSLLMSAFNGVWIGWRSALFQVLFSSIISLSVTNSIYLSQHLLRFNKQRFIWFIISYYTASLLGMFLAIELIYLIQAVLFHTSYHFFHLQDVLFSSLVVVIACTIIFAYHTQKDQLTARLKEKDINMLQLKQMKTQAELATLHAKINPHFLYNALNAIAGLIHDDPDKAELMTIKLSKLFRYNINQDQNHLVPLEEEMEIVSTYLDIEKVRFGDRINFSITVDEHLTDSLFPRFLLQPLIENALKHGLNNVTDQGELNIEIRKIAGIELIIADNGTAFPQELNIGYGLQSTYDKLNLLFPDQYEIQILNTPFKHIKIQIPLSNA